MSDTRLRALERAALATGCKSAAQHYLRALRRTVPTPEDLLRSRVQVGDLREDRLRLAVYLGDPIAARALTIAGPAFWRRRRPDRLALRKWGLGFRAFDQEARVRVAEVVARSWAGLCQEHAHVRWLSPRLNLGLAALRAWLAEPSEANRADCGRAAGAIGWGPYGRWEERNSFPQRACEIVCNAAMVGACKAPGDASAHLASAIAAADSPPPQVSGRAAKRAGIGRWRLRCTVRAALVPWALE